MCLPSVLSDRCAQGREEGKEGGRKGFFSAACGRLWSPTPKMSFILPGDHLCFYKSINCSPRPGTVLRETPASGSATSPVALVTDLCDHTGLNALESSRPGRVLSVTTGGFPELELPLLAAKELRNPARNDFSPQ